MGFTLAAALYISAFCGNVARYLPAPLDGWHHVYHARLFDTWAARVVPGLAPVDQRVAYLFAEIWVLGLAVPALALWLWGRRPAEAGLAAPHAAGRRLTPVIALVAIPVGFALYLLLPAPRAPPARFLVALVAMVPEHFLFFGACLSALLPGHRLPRTPPPAPIWRHPWRDLDSATIAALAAVAALFCMAHAGKGHVLETVLSFPAGLFSAYVTLRSGSIWPAVLAHWTLNLVPYFTLRGLA